MIDKDVEKVLKVIIFKKYSSKEMEIKFCLEKDRGLGKMLKYNFIEMEKISYIFQKYISLHHIYISCMCAMHMAII